MTGSVGKSGSRVTITAHGRYADAILEHVINPALKDFECKVFWPDMAENKIAVTFDHDELCGLINAHSS